MREENKRWWALGVLCLGQLMIVLDTTIVNVALPSIQSSLHFTDASLAWVVNAYLLMFGGFLLLGGRLGDIFGHRKLFLIGASVFTLASLLCGLSFSMWVLIVARAIQGLGGAILAAVALSLIMNLFSEPNDRTRAMGFFGFVAAGGGSIGVLLGGLLTGFLNWHWIFLVNIPIGIAVVFATLKLIPAAEKKDKERVSLDFGGAITITASIISAVYAVINGNSAGWKSLSTLGLLALSLVLLFVFTLIEKKVKNPLVPLPMLKMRNIAASNIMGVLWAGGMFSWFFISALYLQLILKYTPLQVGLAFLPANIIMGIFSWSLSAKLVMRFGIKKPLVIGLSFVTLGLFLLSFAPIGGHFIWNILPSMIFLGTGAGMAFNPMLLAAMNDAGREESGLASGLVNTSFMMGGALGLAILASIASLYTAKLLGAGVGNLMALNQGYHVAFQGGAIAAALGVLVGILFLKPKETPRSANV